MHLPLELRLERLGNSPPTITLSVSIPSNLIDPTAGDSVIYFPESKVRLTYFPGLVTFTSCH